MSPPRTCARLLSCVGWRRRDTEQGQAFGQDDFGCQQQIETGIAQVFLTDQDLGPVVIRVEIRSQ